MKKVLSLVLAVLMTLAAIVALTACQPQNEALDKAYNNYLAGVKAPTDASLPVLTIATSPDFAPMEFYDTAKSGTDAIVGFDLLLANYLAKELNMQLVITPMSFDAVQAAVQTGKADIGISGFSWTADRAENYELSNWYVAGENETEQVLITTKANEGKFTTKESLNGKKIGYQGASLQEVLVKETFADNADISQAYVDLGTAVEALKTGKIDALAVAKGNGESIISNANDTIAFAGYDFEVADLYKNNLCLIQKGNTELLAKVNAALDKAMENDYYTGWYESCKIYSGISTLDELGYDDNGVKIAE